MHLKSILIAVCFFTLACQDVFSEAVQLSEVPAYLWYHGCGPTAAASIIGYYDLHGFDNLFNASGWNNVKLTTNVQEQISSSAHNAAYDATPNSGSLSTSQYTSIADWFRTSDSPDQYGWSNQSYADDAFVGYATYRGYKCTASYSYYGIGLTWATFTAEINAGRPMMFLVDTNGDGSTDHFVPVFGYEERSDGDYYCCYTTWAEDETTATAWYKFQKIASGANWGVAYGTFVQITPEPSTLFMLFPIGFLAASLFRKRLARSFRIRF